MEESKIEPAGNLTVFRPHRRRHLNSGTYRTLVHILSHCYDEPKRAVSDQNVAQEINQDNGSTKSVQATEKEVCGNVELSGHESRKPDHSAGQQVRVAGESFDSDGFRERIEQIESILNVEEDEDLLQQKCGMDIENTLPIDLQDLVFGPENTLMDELEWIVKGNENSTPKPSATSLDQNRNGITLDAEPIMQEKEMELETFVSSEDAKETFIPSAEVAPIKEPENFSEKVPQAFGVSVNKDMVAEASNSTECSKNESSSREADYLEVLHEMQQKAKEQEKIVCTSSAMSSPNDMNDGNTEEGEISGDDGMDDQSMDVILHDTLVLEENKVNEGPISKEANEKDLDSNSFLVDMVDEGNKMGRGLELRGSSKTDTISIPEAVQGKNVRAIQIAYSDPLLEGRRNEMNDNGIRMGIACPATGNLGAVYEGKWDDGSCQKRKRGPPSKEKKERKKAKERKKRAEMERKLGVKRLKLQIIQKPKTVAYCRHYVRGRCHEGDKCKFSHDTEPITKSKPCVHFARQSCMKGENCPYDHQLFKYHCNNFKESGFCARGDRCLFLHKMPSKEDSATAASKPELKPSVVQDNCKSQLVNIGGASQQNAHALAHSTGIHSRKPTKQNLTETVTKQPELAAKGISFPLISSSPLVHPSPYKQGGLAPNTNTGAVSGNQKDQNPLGSVERTNAISVRTPPVTTPKGINFLSFGKASPNDSKGKTQVCHHSASLSETVQKLNGMLKANQLVASQGTSFNPFGKAPVANSTSDTLVSLPSRSDNASSGDSLQSRNAADQPQNSSTISLRQTPSSFTGQSSVGIASRFCKDTANSSHRGLFSTLAFAAKYTGQNMNHSSGSTGTLVDKETRNSTS